MAKINKLHRYGILMFLFNHINLLLIPMKPCPIFTNSNETVPYIYYCVAPTRDRVFHKLLKDPRFNNNVNR